MSEIRNLTRNGETFYPLTCTDAVLDRDGNVVGEINDIFDISEYNASGTPLVLAKYASLSLALAAVPTSKQKGGMIIRYVQNSDNTYVQFRYMGTAVTGTPNPFLDTANWQGVDDEPTAGSDNLVKSGGVAKSLSDINNDIYGDSLIPFLTEKELMTFTNVFPGGVNITSNVDAQGNASYVFTKLTANSWAVATIPHDFTVDKRYKVHFKLSGIPSESSFDFGIKGSVSFDVSSISFRYTEDGEFSYDFVARYNFRVFVITIGGDNAINVPITLSELYIDEITEDISISQEIDTLKETENKAIYNDQHFDVTLNNGGQGLANLPYSIFTGERYYYEVYARDPMKTVSLGYGPVGSVRTIGSGNRVNSLIGSFVAEIPYPTVGINSAIVGGKNFDYTQEVVKVRLYQMKTINEIIVKPLAGKTINFLGDSITSLDYTTPTWWQYLAEKLGFTGVPYAVSGTTISKLNVWPDQPFCERYANMADADAVVIMGGTNDGSHHPQIGSIDSDNITTLRGAMNVMLQGLFVMYPGKPILFITPPQRAKTYETYTGYVDISQLNDTDTLDFPQVVECIKQCCNRYSVPCLDLFNGGGFNGAETDDGSYVYYRGNTQQGLDDVHPSELGQKKLAKVIEQFLLDNI